MTTGTRPWIGRVMETQPGESRCSNNVAEMSEGSAHSEVLQARSSGAGDHVEASSGGTGNCEGASPSHCRILAPLTPEEGDIRRRTTQDSRISPSEVDGRGLSKGLALSSRMNTEVTNSVEQTRIAKPLQFPGREIAAKCVVSGETTPERPPAVELQPPAAPIKPRREPAARRGMQGTGTRRRLDF